MSDFGGYPLSAICSGIRTAWGMVLGVVAAAYVGILVGLMASGFGAWPSGLLLLGAVGLPLTMYLDGFGLAMLACLVVSIAVFWFSDRFWLEGLVGIAAAAAAQTVHLCFGLGFPHPSQIAPVAAACAVLAVPYAVLRIVAYMRHQQLTSEGEEVDDVEET